jgi:hypothetical protein
MQWAVLLAIGLCMLAVSVSMMLFEYSRNRSGRRLFKSEPIAMPYWLIYLLLPRSGNLNRGLRARESIAAIIPLSHSFDTFRHQVILVIEAVL